MMLQSKTKRFRNVIKEIAYLGIDAGSTTTKVALISEEGDLLYTHYGSNQGSPLKFNYQSFKRTLYNNFLKGAKIVNSTVTGYGEALLKLL